MRPKYRSESGTEVSFEAHSSRKYDLVVGLGDLLGDFLTALHRKA